MSVELGNSIKDVNLGMSQVGKRASPHVACVLVFSKQVMMPSRLVAFTDDTYTEVVNAHHPLNKYHAIVNPFLPYTEQIKPNTPFWVILPPDNARSLVHHFEIDLKDVPKAAVTKKDTALDYVDPPISKPSSVPSYEEDELEEYYKNNWENSDDCSSRGC